MKTKLLGLALLSLFSLLLPQHSPFAAATSGAGIIWEESFDNSPDWTSGQFPYGQPSYPNSPPLFASTWIGNPNRLYSPPPGWTAFNAVPSCWTDFTGNDTYVISSAGSRTSGGKGLTVSYDSCPSDQWVGGRMDKWLGYPGYQDIYIRFYAKYPKTFYWTSGAEYKVFRLSARPSLLGYQGPGYMGNIQSAPEGYGATSDNILWATPEWYHNGSFGGSSPLLEWIFYGPDGQGISNVWDGYASPQNARWQGNNVAAPNEQGDGLWHSYEYHAKLNSAPGVADGKFEVWIDGGTNGQPTASNTKVAWLKSIPWQPNHAYPSTYDASPAVRITPLNSNKVFRVIAPTAHGATGTSCAVEPDWSSLVHEGDTLVDCGVTWMYEFTPAFNWIMFSDNMINPYYPAAQKKESQFYYDDLVISTNYIGPDYVIPSGPTPDTAAPTVPTNLSVTSMSSSQIRLSWTASTDNVGVEGYSVYRNGSLLAATTDTTYLDPAVTPLTTYTYTVAAYDAAGNVSAQSAPVSATAQAKDHTPPAAPKGLRLR